ncbi:AfsR/SARP family transcriptional regulator [Streptomyces sulphureus]|uniref:AfsR/SARP family transcriptional regulator n=1 Tax=Streptomyces sulphureus TaxID=47758 RepID=UPI0003623B8B|nr:BTAD domain-containing putative transcriptional regulator [Streptomyces sulphureus]
MPLGGARLRALLTVLAVAGGRAVRTGELVAEVWGAGEDPPADAPAAVQALVGRLRRVLGWEAVVREAGGYRLAAERDDVDLHRFERLAAEGAGALKDGDPEKAAGLLVDALALWRGEPLADLPGGGSSSEARSARTRLLVARRHLLEAELALGRAESILPAARELATDHPLDEPVQALYLRALRDAGRQAEALAAYEAIRTVLVERLGADPGPELRALHAELLRHPAGAIGSSDVGDRPADASQPPHVSGRRADERRAPDGESDFVGRDSRPAAADGPSGDEGHPVDACEPPRANGRPAAATQSPHVGDHPVDAGQSSDGEGHSAGRGSRPGAAHGPSHDGKHPTDASAPTDVSKPPHTNGRPTDASAPPHTNGRPADASQPPPVRAAPAGTSRPETANSPSSNGSHPTDASHRPPAHTHPTDAGNRHEPENAPQGAPQRPVDASEPPSRRAGLSGPAALRVARRSGNLRARLTSFVGREEEVAALGRELAAARLVTLTGPGGAGKTRLSQEAAESVCPEAALAGAGGTAATPSPSPSPSPADGARWPDGVWVAELAPVREAATVPEAVLTALGGRETQIRGSVAAEGLRAAEQATDALTQLAERCAPRTMLLVLDNCEHVIDAAAELVERLLVECPGVTVLATSREPLGVPGEVVRPLLPLPDASALRLLADRGAAARPGFDLAEDPEACAEICRRLDGLPLAIELAAARLRSLTPRQLADRLDDRFRLLTSGSRTVLPRQQTLRAVVDWSWELLADEERAVLRRLSVFSGGSTLARAEEVCGGTGEHDVDSADVPALLASLVDKSLVIPELATGDDETRYRLLETVGEYAAERLDEAGERAATERRHLVAFREAARAADRLLRGPQQRRALDELESDHDNVRTALARAIGAGDEEEALCLTLSMIWFWRLRNHSTDACAWARATADLGPDPFAAPVVPAADVSEPVNSPPPLGPELLQEARRAVRLMTLADEDAPSRAETAEFQEALARVVATYEPGQPQVCRLPGMMWIFAWVLSGRVAELSEVLDATIERCRERGDDWHLAFALHMRARMANEQPGGTEQAVRDSEECLALFVAEGDAWGVAEARSGRGEVRNLRGEYVAAAEDFRAAIECAQRLGIEGQLPNFRSRLGAALIETGDPDDVAEGAALLCDALDESSRSHGDDWHFIGVQYAIYLLRFGPVEEAVALLTTMEEELRSRPSAVFRGMVQTLLAWGYAASGQHARALVTLRDALPNIRGAFAELISPSLGANQLPIAAWSHAALGDPELAARLLGAYARELPGLLHLPAPSEPGREAVRRTAEATARKALRAAMGHEEGDAAFEAAFVQGRELSLAEATELI